MGEKKKPMLRRVLAIASFVLVLPASAMAVSALIGLPEAIVTAGKYPEALILWSARFLFPFSGAVASFCNGYHLLRGSMPGSAFRRLLHVSNVTFAILLGLVAYFLYVMTVGYRPPARSLQSTILFFAWAAVPFLIVAIYMLLLFWRGAVTDPLSARPMLEKEREGPR